MWIGQLFYGTQRHNSMTHCVYSFFYNEFFFRNCVQTIWLFAFQYISHSTLSLHWTGTEKGKADIWKVRFHKSLCNLASSWIHTMKDVDTRMYGEKYIAHFYLILFCIIILFSTCKVLGSYSKSFNIWLLAFCFHVYKIALKITFSYIAQGSWKRKIFSHFPESLNSFSENPVTCCICY